MSSLSMNFLLYFSSDSAAYGRVSGYHFHLWAHLGFGIRRLMKLIVYVGAGVGEGEVEEEDHPLPVPTMWGQGTV